MIFSSDSQRYPPPGGYTYYTAMHEHSFKHEKYNKCGTRFVQKKMVGLPLIILNPVADIRVYDILTGISMNKEYFKFTQAFLSIYEA